MLASFVPKSGNSKTGPIPVSYTEASSCPTRCPLKNKGCYAEHGPTQIHWGRTAKSGLSWDAFCARIDLLPTGTLWRHNVAGDLPGDGAVIDRAALSQLVAANKGKKGFTYTHYDPKKNASAIRNANRRGFRVNLSANDIGQADEYKALGVGPVVVIVAEGVTQAFRTPNGHRVVVCPAVTRDDVTCESCGLCSLERDVIVAFPAHGARRKIVAIMAAN